MRALPDRQKKADDVTQRYRARDGPSVPRSIGSRLPAGLEGSTLHLAILRNLRRVNSHVSAIAYDVLGWVDPLKNQDDSPGDAVESTSTTPLALAQ
jgi:hypothetical protein